MLCCYIIPDGQYKGFICPNLQTKSGFCDKCYGFFKIRKVVGYDEILEYMCDNNYYDMFYRYLLNGIFTHEQINNCLISILKQYSHDKYNMVKELFFYKKYFPDYNNYNILTNISLRSIPQDLLSNFFHKRFLVKNIINNINLDDILPRILDPFMNFQVNSPYYNKCILHTRLFTDIMIDPRLPHVSMIPIESRCYLNVKTYKYPHTYITEEKYILYTHGNADNFYFIGKQFSKLSSGNVKVFSKIELIHPDVISSSSISTDENKKNNDIIDLNEDDLAKIMNLSRDYEFIPRL